MQIVHEEARRLIHFNLDNALSSDRQASLSTHLQECPECRAYARELEEVDFILRPLLKRQWSAHAVPLRIRSLLGNERPKSFAQHFLTMRSLVFAVVLLGFAFSAWQFAFSGTWMVGPVPPSVLPAPTPSVEFTSTQSPWANCSIVRHTVRENETLEIIARRFSVSGEDLLAFNDLTSQSLTTGVELGIPVCHFTPTGTASNATSLTLTYAPALSPTTSTPDG